jgi:integrase
MSEPQNSRATCSPKSAWYKGKVVGPKPPRQHVWAICTRLHLDGRLRGLALFNLAVDSKLRACDLVRLRVEDVAPHGYAVQQASVQQRKLAPGLVRDHRAVSRSRGHLSGGRRQHKVEPWVFPGRRGGPPAPSPIRSTAGPLAIRDRIGTGPVWPHSLRRTKATLIYRRTGNLRAVQLLLGHS